MTKKQNDDYSISNNYVDYSSKPAIDKSKVTTSFVYPTLTQKQPRKE